MKHVIRRLLAALVGFAFAGIGLAQEVSWPDTVGGRFGRDFFAAYADQTDAELERFVDEHHSRDYFEKEKSREELIADMRSIHSQVGALDLRSVESLGEHAVRALAYSERFGMWLKCEFELEPEPPHDPARIAIRPTQAPDQEGPGDYADWETLEQLAELVRADLGAPGFALAVVRGDEIKSAVAGMRRAGGEDEVLIDDRFHIGSVTKSLTSTLIGRLVELDKLSFSATVGEVLAEVDMRDEYRDVTLKDLLQHRGGIPPMPSGGVFANGYSAIEAESPVQGRTLLAAQVLTEEPAVEPGTTIVYSNAGYVVAALMVERLLDASWEELLVEHVFRPLELSTACFGWPATAERAAQPCGHFGAGDDLKVQEIGEHALGGIDLGLLLAPAGDVSMSIGDLARYARFHLAGLRGRDGHLKAETIRELHEPPSQDDPARGYACGWGRALTPEGRAYQWHNGSGGTFFALVTIYPASDLAVVSASNVGIVADGYHEALHEALSTRHRASEVDAENDGTGH